MLNGQKHLSHRVIQNRLFQEATTFLNAQMDRADANRPRTLASNVLSQDATCIMGQCEARENLLFGEPGAGKSTFLRFLALDLLQEAPLMADTAKRWGDHIPIWIPFALWTKVIGSSAIADRSIAAIVTSFLQELGRSASCIPSKGGPERREGASLTRRT